MVTKEGFEKVREQLLKRGVESLLRIEMTAHLGYQKGQSKPRGNQRNGFSEKMLKKQNGAQRIKVLVAIIIVRWQGFLAKNQLEEAKKTKSETEKLLEVIKNRVQRIETIR